MASSSDDLRPSTFTRVHPPGVARRPDKYVRKLKTDVALAVGLSAGLPEYYAASLTALIEELQNNHRGTINIPLENGVRLPLDGQGFGYSFHYGEMESVFEGASVRLIADKQNHAAHVVSILGTQLILGVNDDLVRALGSHAHCAAEA